MEQNKIDFIFFGLSILLISLLLYSGYLSYKSIDHKVLQTLESQKIAYPPIPTTPVASPSNALKNK